MAQSTRTKLQLANDVLLNINERPRNNLQGAFGDRINNAIRSAVNEVNTLNDWSWLRRQQTATSWQDEVAQLPVFQRLFSVKWKENSGFKRKRPLKYVSRDVFDDMPKDSYDSNNPQRPRWFTILDDKTVGVAPYPTDSAERARILFDFVRFTGIPSQDNGTFEIPEEYMQLVEYRTSAILAQNHLGDLQLAGTFSQQFEALAQRLRDRDRGVPAEGINMFRPRH